MEGARILRYSVQLPPQRTEGSSVHAVAVCGSNNVWSRLVDRGVYHESRGVEKPDFTTVNDLASLGYLDQVRSLDQGEGDAEWVYPEGGRVNGVLHKIRLVALCMQIRDNGPNRPTLIVMCPATPSSKPSLPKILNAAANLPFRYSLSSYGSWNLGGPGNFGICTLAFSWLKPGS